MNSRITANRGHGVMQGSKRGHDTLGAVRGQGVMRIYVCADHDPAPTANETRKLHGPTGGSVPARKLHPDEINFLRRLGWR